MLSSTGSWCLAKLNLDIIRSTFFCTNVQGRTGNYTGPGKIQGQRIIILTNQSLGGNPSQTSGKSVLNHGIYTLAIIVILYMPKCLEPDLL